MTQKQQFLEVKQQRSYVLFTNVINSPATLKNYDLNLTNFMLWAEIKDYDTLSSLKTDVIQEKMENYVLAHKKRNPNLRRKTFTNKLAPVELFLDVNKILYHKRALHLLFGKDDQKKGNELPYTTDDVQKMLDVTKIKRNRAVILFFSSVGGRPSVISDPVLRFKHVYPVLFGCKAILFYSDSNEEYWGFLTPESSKALDDYVDWRINKGERITKESPVFVEKSSKNGSYDVENLQPLSYEGLHHILRRTLKNSDVERIKTGFRYDKAIFYGFRKRFNTVLKIDSEINSNIAEKLMAHKNGLDGVYFKPTREDCFKEFLKAIPGLTINEAERLKIKVDDLEKSKEEIIKQYETRLIGSEKILKELINRLEKNSTS